MVSSPNDSLGLQVRSLSCWEYGSILLPPPDSCEEDFLSGDLVPLGELRVVSAWFGDANDPSLCTEITEEVQRQHAEAASQGRRVEIAATARRWGDPATFRLKQMEITYEHQWLSSDRREVLLTLKARAEEKAQGAEVEALLKRLSAAMLGTVAGEDSLGSTSPRWRQLGFQSNDPRSDLRTGLLALDCLVFMAERYPLANSQMIREAQSTGIDYPFAVASINVTQHLARYLHLVRDAVGCALDIASPRTVHRFAGLLQRQEEPIDVTVPFCELHAAVMTRLHCNWRRRKREDPQITVMSFAPVLEETLKSTRRFCEGALMSSSSEFRSWVDETEVRDGAEPPLSVPSVAFRPEEENQITESLQQTVRQVSETASILGTYLQGVISERWPLQQPKT